MKRFILFLMAIALVVAAVSCDKKKKVNLSKENSQNESRFDDGVSFDIAQNETENDDEKDSNVSGFDGETQDGKPIYDTITSADGNTSSLDAQNTTIKFDNGDKYVGDIDGALRHGFGVMIYANGDRYEGNWAMDVIEGKGSFYYANGDVYSGDFVNGNPEGYGIYSFANGDFYEGEFKNGMFHGQGTYNFLNGTVYTGEFYEGARHGNGEIIYLNGERYEGNWVHDKRDGESGELKYSNGDEYFGAFINNMPDTRIRNEKGEFETDEDGKYLHGAKSMYYFADGRTYAGYFEEGKIVTADGSQAPPDISPFTEESNHISQPAE